MSVLPRNFFHVSLLLPVSAPEKICFLFLFSHTTGSEPIVVQLSEALCVFTLASFLLDDSILRGKGESEKERKLLRAVHLGIDHFFLKAGCCLLSDLNLHVLRMRNKSLHKNPKVSCFRVSFSPQWSVLREFKLFY